MIQLVAIYTKLEMMNVHHAGAPSTLYDLRKDKVDADVLLFIADPNTVQDFSTEDVKVFRDRNY